MAVKMPFYIWASLAVSSAAMLFGYDRQPANAAMIFANAIY
jgi:hypothetical protein